MTTWTMDTVFAVGRLHTTAHVDKAAIAAAPDGVVMESTRSRLASLFVHEAHALAVDVHPGDLAFGETPERFSVVVEARWHPPTRVVQLRGGQSDGQTLEIRDVWAPLRVPVQPTGSPWSDDADIMATIQAHTYELTGWSEAERVWIFELTGS